MYSTRTIDCIFKINFFFKLKAYFDLLYAVALSFYLVATLVFQILRILRHKIFKKIYSAKKLQ